LVNALSSKRAYRDAWRYETVFNHIVDLSGTHFDPSVTPTSGCETPEPSQLVRLVDFFAGEVRLSWNFYRDWL
jgi:hypothetical protein